VFHVQGDVAGYELPIDLETLTPRPLPSRTEAERNRAAVLGQMDGKHFALPKQGDAGKGDEIQAMFHFGLTVASPAIAAALALISVLILSAHSHDYKRSDLDSWYENLHRPTNGFRSTSCCSKQDCHTTEAELRNGEWWARIGKPIDRPDGTRDWELGEYTKIPDELIVRGANGLPVPNEAGEAVICHSFGVVGSKISPAASTIYCFVPPDQS
jgi:hypothetical protein